MTSNRIRWACRRGMLELDLFLLPFSEQVFPHLSEKEQTLFWQLLEESDTDLQHWLVHQISPVNEQYKDLVVTIRDFRKSLVN